MKNRDPLWTPKGDATDIETLKAWCHWKRKENPPIDEDEASFVKTIEDTISQAGMVPALKAQLDTVNQERLGLKSDYEFQSDWYAVRWERLRDLFRGTELETPACSIMANGTAEVFEPPTYAQRLSISGYEASRLRDALNEVARVLLHADHPLSIFQPGSKAARLWEGVMDAHRIILSALAADRLKPVASSEPDRLKPDESRQSGGVNGGMK